MSIKPAFRFWGSFALVLLPLSALVISWPQQAPHGGSPPPRGSVEVDNVAEPFHVRLKNNAGRLEVLTPATPVEWTDLHGRTYRATITINRKKSP